LAHAQIKVKTQRTATPPQKMHECTGLQLGAGALEV